MISKIIFFIVVVTVGLTSTFDGYLKLPINYILPHAPLFCNDLGFAVLELRSQNDLDLWNAARPSVMTTNASVWIGLVRDEASATNFSWLTGGDADWFKWAPDHPKDNDTYACVQHNVELDAFETVSCIKGAAVVCHRQVPATAKRCYIKDRNPVMSSTSSLGGFKRNEVPVIDPSWIPTYTRRPAGDLESCLLACHLEPKCAMSFFRYAYHCMLFMEV